MKETKWKISLETEKACGIPFDGRGTCERAIERVKRDSQRSFQHQKLKRWDRSFWNFFILFFKRRLERREWRGRAVNVGSDYGFVLRHERLLSLSLSLFSSVDGPSWEWLSNKFSVRRQHAFQGECQIYTAVIFWWITGHRKESRPSPLSTYLKTNPSHSTLLLLYHHDQLPKLTLHILTLF